MNRERDREHAFTIHCLTPHRPTRRTEHETGVEKTEWPDRSCSADRSVQQWDGNLKYYLRQDGAPLVAEKISQMKAFTAVAMEKSTAEVGEILKAETPGIELVPNLIKFGGGIPIKNSKGQILGGIGVSGASKEDDAACAQAGLDAVKAMLN